MSLNLKNAGRLIVTTDFVELTEIAGDLVTPEQVERIARRYYWAGEYCHGKDVLEVACGTGQGVGYLAQIARSVVAGDYSEAILAIARKHYGSRFEFRQFDAQEVPFPDRSFDVIIIFEALYYIPDAQRFFRECVRLLRPGGYLLIATANKDLYDFTPSPHSHRYFGLIELGEELGRLGFKTTFYGDTPIGTLSTRQRLLRPLKAFASRLGLIPKSMNAKKLLKRLVFGRLVPMPAEISGDTAIKIPPTGLPPAVPDRGHKVIFCAAMRGA